MTLTRHYYLRFRAMGLRSHAALTCAYLFARQRQTVLNYYECAETFRDCTDSQLRDVRAAVAHVPARRSYP